MRKFHEIYFLTHKVKARRLGARCLKTMHRAANFFFCSMCTEHTYLRIPLLFIDAVHFGQYHLPFGGCVMPTHG